MQSMWGNCFISPSSVVGVEPKCCLGNIWLSVGRLFTLEMYFRNPFFILPRICIPTNRHRQQHCSSSSSRPHQQKYHHVVVVGGGEAKRAFSRATTTTATKQHSIQRVKHLRPSVSLINSSTMCTRCWSAGQFGTQKASRVVDWWDESLRIIRIQIEALEIRRTGVWRFRDKNITICLHFRSFACWKDSFCSFIRSSCPCASSFSQFVGSCLDFIWCLLVALPPFHVYLRLGLPTKRWEDSVINLIPYTVLVTGWECLNCFLRKLRCEQEVGFPAIGFCR